MHSEKKKNRKHYADKTTIATQTTSCCRLMDSGEPEHERKTKKGNEKTKT